jgi:hypothetical protein
MTNNKTLKEPIMAKKKKRRASKKTATQSAAPRRGKLSSVDTSALEQELQRRRRGLGGLERKHQKLLSQLAALEAQMAALGGPISAGSSGGTARRGRPPGRKRPENSSTLVDALAKTLKGKTMGVTEAAEAVVAGGYNTNAENFRTIVNQTLLKHTDVFKKVSRGQYTAK